MSDPQDSQQEEPTPAWKWFLYSAGSIGLAVLVFFLLKNMEETGREGRMNWIIVILYKIGGKWTAAGVLGGLGVLFAVLGFAALGSEQGGGGTKTGRRRRRSEDDDEDLDRAKRRRRSSEDEDE